MSMSFQYGFDGQNHVPILVANVFKPFNIADASTEQVIWTPTTGKKFRLMGIAVGVTTAQVLIFKDGASGVIIFQGRLSATFTHIDLGNGILSSAVGNVLAMIHATTGLVSGTVWGIEE